MKRLKSLTLIILSIMTMLTIVSCGDNKSKESTQAKTRIVNTINGDVEIPTNPKKIVDLAGVAEELLILGYTPIATTYVDPHGESKVPEYLEYTLRKCKVVENSDINNIDLDKIGSYNPDLIIIDESQKDLYDELSNITATIMIPNYESNWKDKLNYLCELLDKEEEATKWLNEYKSKTESAGKKINKSNEEESFLAVLAYEDSFKIFTSEGLGSLIYDDMNLTKPKDLAEENSGLIESTIEEINNINADNIIIILDDEAKEKLSNNDIWKNLKAVKEGTVISFNISPVLNGVYNPVGRTMIIETIKEGFTK